MKKHKAYQFQKFKTIRSFGREIYNNNLSLDDATEQQMILKSNNDKIFKETTKPKESIKNEKSPILKNAIIILNRRQKLLNAFESGIFLK